jgi:hypothetical protein
MKISAQVAACVTIGHLVYLSRMGHCGPKCGPRWRRKSFFFYPSLCPSEPNDDLNLGLVGVAADSRRFLPRSFGGLHRPICLR